MVQIETLRRNGKEKIAHQHVIDRVLQRDKERRQETKRSKWWKDLTSEISEDLEPDLVENDLDVHDIVVFTEVAPGYEEEGRTPHDYLRNFIATDDYKELDKMLNGYLEVADGKEDVDAIFREFAGATFETLAHRYFTDEQNRGVTVLDPQETDAYFLRHFEDREMISHPFGKIGIEGIVVPDCLVLDGKNVKKQAEFSLHGKEGYYHHKYDGFLRNKYASTFRDSYDEDTQLVFGVTKDFPEDLQASLLACYGTDIDFFKVPFTRTQFYREVLSPLSYLWQND